MMKELDVDFKDTVVLDNDIYVLRRTMILPNISRIRVYGTRNTTIVWEGASDEDMFVVSGGFGHIFSGITFDGKGIARNVFMQKYDMFPALGSGKHMWDTS